MQMLAIVEPENKEKFYKNLKNAIEKVNLISNVYHLTDKEREKLLEEYPGYHESFLMCHKDFLTKDHFWIWDFNWVEHHIYDMDWNIEFQDRGKEKSTLWEIDTSIYRHGWTDLNNDRLRGLLDDFLEYLYRQKALLNLMYCVPYELPSHIWVKDGNKNAKQLLKISDEYKEFWFESDMSVAVTKLNFISHFAYLSYDEENIKFKNHENQLEQKHKIFNKELFPFFTNYSVFSLEYSAFWGKNALNMIDF